MARSTTRDPTTNDAGEDTKKKTIDGNHLHQHRCGVEGGYKNCRISMDFLRQHMEAAPTRKYYRGVGEFTDRRDHLKGLF